ncbi:hypothetical protein IFM89_012282 [Coptis chinensis]|uniref:SOSEKI DIX-like domain-containing protein n=1 Tax=Coptis chinensis TaxID=261450 RepID=A0A835HAY2_9MAGN|nr:hypothetical protein IFM89_012282 [Coptis chinensis]
MGRVEHPHLIRVNHLTHNDIHLRDVKKWISDFRGKDVPDSFAWSCKRYRTGYVWQDLMDDDLVSPNSDHEYVLKGSQIPDSIACGENKVSVQRVGPQESPEETIPDTMIESYTKLFEPEKNSSRLLPLESPVKPNVDSIPKQNNKQYPLQHKLQKPLYGRILNNKLFNLEEPLTMPSPAGPSESEISRMTNEWNFPIKEGKHYWMTTVSEIDEVIDDAENSSSCSSKASSGLFQNEIIERDELFITPPSQYMSPKKKSYSSGTSNVLLSLLTCGVIETNDSAMKVIKKNSTSPSTGADDTSNNNMLRESGKISNVARKQQHSTRGCCIGMMTPEESSEFTIHKTWSNTKPAMVPNCSLLMNNCRQCGKGFKPDKLHKHMKTCKGLKNQGKVDRVASSIVERMSAENGGC